MNEYYLKLIERSVSSIASSLKNLERHYGVDDTTPKYNAEDEISEEDQAKILAGVKEISAGSKDILKGLDDIGHKIKHM